MDASIHELFESQVERSPDAVALVFEGPVGAPVSLLTYRELNRRANQVAHHLRALGVGPEVLVGICAERSLEMVVGVLGILKAGGAYLPLDPEYPQERLAFMLEDARVPVLLAGARVLDRLPKHQARVVCPDSDWEAINQQSEENPSSGVTPENLAYAIYTSGSTGKPKGVLVSHSNVVRLFAATKSWFHFDERDVWTLFHSYAFDFSVWELWGALLHGGRLVVVPYWVSRSPEAFYELLCAHQVTVLNQTPSAFRQLIRVGDSAVSHQQLNLRSVIFGGEALELLSLKPWFDRHPDSCPQLVNMYGITETTVHVTYRPLTAADISGTGSAIGSPIPDLQVYLLDQSVLPVPVGAAGELHIGGAGLARGYLNRPEKTAERFIPNPFSDVPGERLYKTGDLARYLPNGDIEYLGRIDNQVKIRGFRIELGEIEAVLWQHPDVREVAVTAREDVPGDKRLVAYIVCKLAPDRIPFKIPCVAEFETAGTIEVQTEDISTGGVCLVGVPDDGLKGERLHLHLQLPGVAGEKCLEGKVAWCQGKRAGIEFALTPTEQAELKQSVEHLLETQGFLKVWQRTVAGSLRRFLKQTLPDYMVPSSFVFLNALPLTPNGKVDRKALPAPPTARPAIEEDFVAPSTRVEEVLAGIWAEVLGIESVGVRDNFLELGGHSLLATRVMSRVRSAFHVELPLRCLFEAPTVAQLAVNLETASREQPELELPPVQPVERNQNLPLSFGQEQLWFLSQLHPDIPVYNEPATVRITGTIDVAALEKALNEIIRRHEALRTHFTAVDGQPVMVIQPAVYLPLPVVNLQAKPESEREAEALRLATLEARRPFDLTSGPLLRATLVQLSDTDSRLFLTLHHIATDGVSLYSVFLPELEALYVAFCAGKPSPLPELPVQYADFAVWQRQWLQGEGDTQASPIAQQLAAWKQQLADLPALQLPFDRPRPAVQTFRGARECLALSKSLTEALRALSQQEGVTLFTTLLAAFKTLLHRYAGQDDIVVGTVTAGRNRPEIENLIGYFLNPLVLRTDMSGNPSFRQLLERVRDVTLKAYALQDLPFEKLVAELQPERNLSQNPLFQVAFVLEPALPALNSGWTVSLLDVDTGTGKFDLTLELDERPEGIIGRFEYSTDLFDAATIRRMVGHFQALLEGIVANRQQCLSDLPLLTGSERQWLLSWNHTQADFPHACIGELFEAQVERTPDAVALVFEGEQLTYRQLNARANQLAHHLRALGVGPEVLAGICAERSPEMVVGILGILKAGGAYLPLDPAYPPERLAFMLEDARVPVLLTGARALGRLPKHKARVVCPDTDGEAISQQSEENPASGVTPDNLAYVIYTSGSTGRPKGVGIPHAGLVNLVAWHQRAYNVTPADRATPLAGPAFDASVWELWPYLTAGASIHIAGQGIRYSPSKLLEWLSTEAITICFLPTPQAEAVLGEQWPTALALRVLLTGGDKLHPIPDKALPFGLFNHYGPTENTVVTTWATVAAGTQTDAPPPIGRPIANTRCFLLDAGLQPVPVGVPGELYIGGAGLARGYLNRPDLTAEKFIPNPYSDAPGERLYKTGDLARYLPDGNIEFLGRIDSQVKIRGFRIEVGEIEAVLWQHPDVREAVVVAREDVPGDKRLVAYVVSGQTPERIPFHSECLAVFEGSYTVPLHTEDISPGGVCLVGVPEIAAGQSVRLRLQLPDSAQEQWLEGRVAWCEGQRAGIEFHLAPPERALLGKSVGYLLETRGFLKVWQRTAAGSLRSFLKEKLPEYMVPSSFVFLNALPLTPNGKVDRKALPAPEGLRPEEATYVAPQTALEQAIAKVWQEVLHLKLVGLHDNFFDLGGHSLRMAQIHSKLREILNTDVSMVDLFKYPTVSSLAKYLSQEPNQEPSLELSRDRAKKQKEAMNRQKQRMQSSRKNNG